MYAENSFIENRYPVIVKMIFLFEKYRERLKQPLLEKDDAKEEN